MKTIPKTGELYKDSTNKIYQVITVAVHAETGEQIVVYQAMYGDYHVYARSLQQFTGEGNRQQLFQKIERAGYQPGNAETARMGYQPGNAETARMGYQPGNAETARPGYQPGNAETARPGYQPGDAETARTGYQPGNTEGAGEGWQLAENRQENTMYPKAESKSVHGPKQQAGNSGMQEYQAGNSQEQERRTGDSRKQEQQSGYVSKMETRPRTQSPAESKRALRQSASETSGEGSYYYEKRRRQMEEREQRREMFRKSERHESATEELRANPCLMKFLEADTYEEKFHVLNEIQNDITDRLIDDIAVVLDVVIPEGSLNDRFHQLRNIILTRQKYETSRFR